MEHPQLEGISRAGTQPHAARALVGLNPKPQTLNAARALVGLGNPPARTHMRTYMWALHAGDRARPQGEEERRRGGGGP